MDISNFPCAKDKHLECSTKVFVEGALGMKAHMSQAVGCLVIIFQADDIKSSKIVVR
jgi:hypothetical protein